jgi:hypothetical protein
MTNSLPRTTLYESFASNTELANLHIHKLDAAGSHLSEPRHPAYDSLKAAGRTVELHIYAQEGNGFLKRENPIDALTRIVQWFETHLKQRPRDGSGAAALCRGTGPMQLAFFPSSWMLTFYIQEM